MKETHFEEKVQQVEVIDRIRCNRCEKPIKQGKEINKNSSNNLREDSVGIDVEFGFMSKEFIQGEKHEIDLCEQCYADIIKTFKIAPKGFGIVNVDEEDKVFVDFKEWKELKK